MPQSAQSDTRRIAFVTGASRGIGRSSALALADAGYDVVVTARTLAAGERHEYSPTLAASLECSLPGTLQETAAAIAQRGRQALPIRLDLLERATVDAAVDRTEAEWGPIDLLLNNGIYQGPGLMDRFLDVPPELVERIFEGNVFAPIHLTQRVVRGMQERGGGIVINMTSNAGRNDPPGPVGRGGWGYVYGASKAAFHRMVGLLHVELASSGLLAYNVDPGYVVTDAMRAVLGTDNDLDERYPGLSPEVPAAVVGWLARGSETARGFAGRTLQAATVCREQQLVADALLDPAGARP